MNKPKSICWNLNRTLEEIHSYNTHDLGVIYQDNQPWDHISTVFDEFDNIMDDMYWLLTEAIEKDLENEV